MKRRRPGWLDDLDAMLAGTGCEVVEASAAPTGTRTSTVEVTSLTHTLRPARETLSIGRGPDGRRLQIAAPDGFLRDQALRRSRLVTTDPNRGLLVDAVLVRRLQMIANRAKARRLVFALSQGTEVRMTEWGDVNHTAMRDGVAFATLSLGHEASWRLGELRLKGRRLPETVLAAMRGRTVSDVMDVPMVGDMVVERMRNGPDGIIARCRPVTEPYTGVWHGLGGE